MTSLSLRNLLLLLALILAGVLATIVLIRYRPASELEEMAKVLPTGVDMTLQDINYTHTEEGVARWRLVAKQAEHRATDKLTELRDLQVTFFDVKGIEQGSVKARSGQVNADFSIIEVHGNVEVTNVKGYTLQTDNLIYRQADRSIRTSAPVRLVSVGLKLDGVGLEMDLDKKRLRIPSRVHAVVHQDKGKKGS